MSDSDNNRPITENGGTTRPGLPKEQRINESFTPTTSTIAPPPPPKFPPKQQPGGGNPNKD